MPYNSNYVAISKKDSIAEDRWNNKEDKQKYRSPFAKDRDRILYSRSFLRMRGKTQVFMPQNLDYIRTRLTHTLEVNQIAKTVATALDINLDLVEAIAYGHDVGHTPFGHVGERALDNILNGCEAIGVEIEADNRGFKHNLQALRLLCDLEQGAAEMGCGGLNLTLFTLWGIAYHTSNEHKKCDMCGDICKSVHTHCKCDRVDNNRPSYSFYFNYMRRVEKYWSFEGLVVKQADEIAQRHHDIEDSIRMGILNKSALVDKMEAMLEGIKLSKEDRKNLKSLKQAISSQDDYFLAIFSRFLVNFYVVDLINHTKHQIKALEEKYRINNHADYINKRDIIKAEDYNNVVVFSPAVKKFEDSFQEYLKENILASYQAQVMDGKGEYIIRRLFNAYVSNPAQLPDHVIMRFYQDINIRINIAGERKTILDNYLKNKNKMVRCIADYIGGMTDTYAYEQYDKLYGTRV